MIGARPRTTALVVAIAGSLATWAARAQDAAESQDGEAYVDRIIAPQQLQDLPPDEGELADIDGLPRSFHAEAVVSRNEYGDDSFDEQGISAGGFWETSTWGASRSTPRCSTAIASASTGSAAAATTAALAARSRCCSAISSRRRLAAGQRPRRAQHPVAAAAAQPVPIFPADGHVRRRQQRVAQ